MCCSTGLCGPNLDPNLVSFASLLQQLKDRGVHVERFNLGQEPIAFVQNPAVRQLLDQEGVEQLPALFWDGALLLKGRYPNETERGEWLNAAPPSEKVPS
jgi:Arsenical resistance operon protein ArsD